MKENRKEEKDEEEIAPVSPECLELTKSFLETYSVARDMLRMIRRGRLKSLSAIDEDYDDEECLYEENDECFWRAKMFAVRKFVLSVENPCYKQFLYFHYIKGVTVEGCAELMSISRRSAFRVKKRALEFATRKYCE